MKPMPATPVFTELLNPPELSREALIHVLACAKVARDISSS